MKRDQPAARHGGNARPMEVVYVTVPPAASCDAGRTRAASHASFAQRPVRAPKDP